MRVDIYKRDELDVTKWSEIAHSGSVFQTYEWAKFFENKTTEPLFFIAKENEGGWCGGFLIFHFKMKYISYFTNKLIIQSEPIIIKKEMREDIINNVWKEIENYAKKENIIYIDGYNLVTSRWCDKNFFLINKFNNIIKYGSHILDLSKPIDTIWDNLHKKHRNMIRSAQAQQGYA